MSDQHSNKQIRISLPYNQFAVGAPMLLDVEYSNTSNELITFNEPEKTWEVQLTIHRKEGDELKVPLGQLSYLNSGGLEMTIVESAKIFPCHLKSNTYFSWTWVSAGSTFYSR